MWETHLECRKKEETREGLEVMPIEYKITAQFSIPCASP